MQLNYLSDHTNKQNKGPLFQMMFWILIVGVFTIACNNETVSEPALGEFLPTEPPGKTIAPQTTTPELIQETSTIQPAETPTTILVTSTPEEAQFPELLMMVTDVQNKGQHDEVHEVWQVNTRTQEKELIFSTSTGTNLSQTIWGDFSLAQIYVAEIKGLGTGQITWQIYEVNYETKDYRTIFPDPQVGIPRLIDTSKQGKWLRLTVENIDPISFKWWFINLETGDLFKGPFENLSLSTFAWSATDANKFALYQQPYVDENGQELPQKIVIVDLTNPDMQQTIDHEYTSLRIQPLLLWDKYNLNQLFVLTPEESYKISLVEQTWVQVAQDLAVFPGNRETQLIQSPSGKWGITTTFVRLIELGEHPQVVEKFDEIIGRDHRFLTWHSDWAIIATGTQIGIYEIGNPSKLIGTIDLNAYDFANIEASSVLATPLER